MDNPHREQPPETRSRAPRHHHPTIANVHRLRSAVENFGGYTIFLGRFFKTVFLPPYEFGQVIRHIDQLGAMSLPLIAVINFIMGLILAMQSRPTMEEFGAQAFIPALVTISLLREIAPVITALIVAGRVGSSIGAEIGSMKVTEQIEALEAMGVDAYNYLVTTRVIAMMILMPALTLFADFVGIVGSYVAEFLTTGVTVHYYYNQVLAALWFLDLVPGVAKTIPFGFAIAIIGCYKGFTATSGTEGVGRATSSAVVLASLWIILIDMVIVRLTLPLYEILYPR